MKKYVVLVKNEIVFRGSEGECLKHAAKLPGAMVVPANAPKHL